MSGRQKPNQTLERRRFLAALGAASLASRVPSARADTATVSRSGPPKAQQPLRFIGVFHPHGCAYELWKPGLDFDLRYPGCSLAPFDSPEQFGKSFKDRLLVIDGLDLAAGIEVGTVGHDASRVILTGTGARGTGPSLDQYLSSDLALGADTPHTSLTLAVGNERPELGQCMSYARGGVPVPKWVDPVRIFDELFGVALTKKTAAELSSMRARDKSVLDFVSGDLARLAQRASAQQGRQLELHHSSLREIEKRLSPVQRRCAAPERPVRSQVPRLRAFNGGEPFFEVITRLQIDLLVRALSCDLTRFATLMLGDLTRSGIYPDLPGDIHQDVAHLYRARADGKPGDEPSWIRLGIQNRHSYGQVALLLQRLDEAELLDDTVVMVQSDMGDPARHSSRNVPTLLAGSSAGRFRLGRFLDLRSAKPKGRLLASNHLLVSIAQAFGADVERFGESTHSTTVTGALSELAG